MLVGEVEVKGSVGRADQMDAKGKRQKRLLCVPRWMGWDGLTD